MFNKSMLFSTSGLNTLHATMIADWSGYFGENNNSYYGYLSNVLTYYDTITLNIGSLNPTTLGEFNVVGLCTGTWPVTYQYLMLDKKYEGDIFVSGTFADYGYKEAVFKYYGGNGNFVTKYHWYYCQYASLFTSGNHSTKTFDVYFELI